MAKIRYPILKSDPSQDNYVSRLDSIGETLGNIQGHLIYAMGEINPDEVLSYMKSMVTNISSCGELSDRLKRDILEHSQKISALTQTSEAKPFNPEYPDIEFYCLNPHSEQNIFRNLGDPKNRRSGNTTSDFVVNHEQAVKGMQELTGNQFNVYVLTNPCNLSSRMAFPTQVDKIFTDAREEYLRLRA